MFQYSIGYIVLIIVLYFIDYTVVIIHSDYIVYFLCDPSASAVVLLLLTQFHDDIRPMAKIHLQPHCSLLVILH